MPKQKIKTPAATQKQIEEWKYKAARWDALNEKIFLCYFDKDGNEIPESEEPGLDHIGELAAAAFGYL